MNDGLARRIAHGLSYPFSPPGESYLFRNGGQQTLVDFDPTDRVPVVASGSNGSPQRLVEKYGDSHDIPVTFGTIRDLVPVFAARLTSYGSIPATLAVIEGAEARVHVTWLTHEQLEIMHGTESVGVGYAYAQLDGFGLNLGPFGSPQTAWAYLSLRGAFAPDDALLPLADVTQHDAQHHAIRRLDIGLDLEAFVARHLQDEPFRRRINDDLAQFGRPITHPGITRLI